MKRKNSLVFMLITGFLLILGFSFIGTTNASASTLEGSNVLVKEGEITPLCLTCGGTITKDYKKTKSVRSWGPWKDALRPIINGGPAGGSKTYTESETYTASISSSLGADAFSLKSVLGYSASYSKTFTESQTFTLIKNKRYKLVHRPTYQVDTIRYSVYNMGIGGKQTFKEYRYVTAKKPIGMEINLVEVK